MRNFKVFFSKLTQESSIFLGKELHVNSVLQGLYWAHNVDAP